VLNPPYIPNFGRAMRWQDTGRAGTLYYPVWLSYATGVLEQAGFETRLVDSPAWGWNRKQVVEDIKSFQPSIIVMDSSFPSLNNDISVAEEIKENFPDIETVLVGPPASQFPDRILKSKGIDIVARWEYDFTVKEIAEALDRGKKVNSVKGISYKNDGEIVHNPTREFADTEDLDRIPFVSAVYKKHLNSRHYFLGDALQPHIQPFSARGCPCLCTFCSWPQTLMGRKYRARSIPNVIDEMEWIQANMPEIRDVYFEDDTFTIDRRRVLSLCYEYIRRGLNISWTCNARADVDLETLKWMKKANCRMIVNGCESGSNVILKNIKKGITAEQITECALNARKAGIMVHADFIIGLPGETWETIKLTRKLINKTRPDLLQVSVASPFPGTEFYDWAKANGYLVTDDPNEYLDEQGHQKSIISYPWLSAKEIVEIVDSILKEYYLSPGYVPVALRQVFRRQGWQEGKRIWNSSRGFVKYIMSR
jgi:anaerobic magnesium-protoporphyrin IX monomethyl ester cyclase